MAKIDDKDGDDDSNGTGCLTVIGAVSISIGCGYLWGKGVGWIAFGSCCLIVVGLAIAAKIAIARQERKA